MNGLALTILVGQLPKLFGFSVDADGLIDEARGFVERAGRRARRSAPRSRSGSSSLALILVLAALAAAGPRRARRGRRSRSRRRRRSTSATTGSRSSGTLPAGLPAAHRARRPVSRPRRCWSPARSGIALVALTDTISTASAFAARTGPGGRRQRRDDRHRRRERRRRVLPGLPGQHQRLAHRGRRAGRRQDAGDRAWSARRRSSLMLLLVPGLLRNLPAARRSPRSSSPRRCRWPTSPATVRLWQQRTRRVPAVDRRVPRRRAARRAARASRSRSRCRSSTCSGGPGGRTRPTLGRVPGMPGYHDAALHPEAEQTARAS